MQFLVFSRLLCPGIRVDTVLMPLLLPVGLGNSSAVGPSMVGQLASSFLDALYKA